MPKSTKSEESAAPASEPSVQCPSVWRDRGYLVLAIEHDPDSDSVLTWNSAAPEALKEYKTKNFLQAFQTAEQYVQPIYLALSVAERAINDRFKMRIRHFRRVVSLISKEGLLSLPNHIVEKYDSEIGNRKLGPIMSEQDKIERATRIMDDIQNAANTAEQAETQTPDAAAAATEGKEKKVTTKKKAKAPAKAAKPAKETKKAAKAPAKKAPVEKKAAKPAAKSAPAKPAKAKAAKKEGDNPFREGTSKAKGYEYFKKVGGDRAKVLAHLESLGIKSAASFYSMYVKV